MKLSNLIPGFMKRLDHYLLVNSPVIWRTRIHYILFFSGIVGNLAAFSLAALFPISKTNVLTVGALQGITFGGYFLIVFVLLYWAYTQFKFKMRFGDIYSKMLTFSIYAAGVLSLILNIAVFQGVAMYRVSNIVSDSDFYADYSYLEKIGALERYGDREVNVEDVRFQDAIKEYGYTVSEYEYFRNDWENPLYDALESIKTSKEEVKGFPYYRNHSESDLVIMNVVFLLLGLFFVPGFMVLISYAKVWELFAVCFLHFLVGITGVFAYELVRFPIEIYYVGAILAICLLLMAVRSHSRLTRLLYFVLIIGLPIASFAVMVENTSRPSDLGGFLETMCFVIPCLAISIVAARFMAKRIGKPELS